MAHTYFHRLGRLVAAGLPLPAALPLALGTDEQVSEALGEAGGMLRESLETGKDVLQLALTGTKAKRKPTAANRKYAKAFKKLKSKFQKKNGGWKKNGFKRCVKAAHKECR
jgi:hypothetical protein